MSARSYYSATIKDFLYRSGTPKREICKTVQRTESGVAARLVHLGIIDNRDIFRDRK